MQLLDADNAAEFLRQTNRIGQEEQVRVSELTGGVSNIVLHVERTGGDDFILKQARERLRVPDDWRCDVRRVWREVETLRACEAALAKVSSTEEEIAATTPRLLFQDRDNFLYAMTAAPPHEVWKSRLLSGDADLRIAAACGRLLARLHAGTWSDDDVRRRLNDRRFFFDLRVDPYYRRVAEVHPGLAPQLDRVIQTLDEHRCCLVHGDFSPKNLLVSPGRLMLVDFEVGHYGDPAFDLGFFLTHLLLKAAHVAPRHEDYLNLTAGFWAVYLAEMKPHAGDRQLEDLMRRSVLHLAACTLARVDGKSQVEYLGKATRERVRAFGTSLLIDPPESWDGVLSTARRPMAEGLKPHHLGTGISDKTPPTV